MFVLRPTHSLRRLCWHAYWGIEGKDTKWDRFNSVQGFCWWLTPQGPNLISADHLISHLRSSTAALVFCSTPATKQELHTKRLMAPRANCQSVLFFPLTHLAKGLLQCMEIAECHIHERNLQKLGQVLRPWQRSQILWPATWLSY